jgi:hypothetical protein
MRLPRPQHRDRSRDGPWRLLAPSMGALVMPYFIQISSHTTPVKTKTGAANPV